MPPPAYLRTQMREARLAPSIRASRKEAFVRQQDAKPRQLLIVIGPVVVVVGGGVIFGVIWLVKRWRF